MARPLLAPLGGIFVSAGLIYALQSSLQSRTSHVQRSLHRANHLLASISEGEVGGTRRGGEEDREWRTPAYDPSGQLSLKEEIKARWNEHLLTFAHTISNLDAEHLYLRSSSLLKSAYSKLSGLPLSDLSLSPSPSPSPTTLHSSPSNPLTYVLEKGTESTSAALTRSGEESPKATLRDPIPRLPDPRLWQPNTYYLGQGCNLREA